MLDWSKSYSSEWRVFKVNRKTWADAERVDNVDSFTLSRTDDGALLESGSLDVTGDFESDYYRIVLTAYQGGSVERVDVATLLFDFTGGEYNHNVTTHNLDGFSVLYPASVSSITIGGYAPAGSDGARYAGDLLESAINAPVEVEGSFTLVDNMVHEFGTTVLDAAWNVLDAGGFIIQVDGSGVVHIRKKPDFSNPSLILDTVKSDIMTNGISFSANISEIPNRYIVIDNNIVTIATNDDTQSPVSTVNRGYNVDVIDTSPALVNSEGYIKYANRMLEENSILKEEKSYVREYAPNVYPYSTIKSSVRGLEGDLRVKSQSIRCDYGITVSEVAVKEHKLYG